ncbi:NADH-quinone oxidoreductase subunit M [Nocardioides yefusunii]|uniref:NADH-quinone oxidoreductase subunit M n=1 Tax=Nocardioides yefusunii TaxID=2500546 RepID=A0ABW1R1R0_9ACTN|nr:NADH-quinone oxidoreductase subunit M [Nocardioides yefusunii]
MGVLTWLVLVPLVGALVVALAPLDASTSKKVGIGFGLAALVLPVVVWFRYSGADADAGGMRFAETHDWITLFGTHWALGVDGISLVMVLLTAFLVPVVMVAEWRRMDEGRPRSFMAWTLALEALSLVVFLATDALLFYVVFEATLIPAYFLVAGFGREGRARAATKFLLFQLAGGLVMLAGIIGLYVVSAQAAAQSGSPGETPSYLLSDLAALDLDPTTQRWLFVAFFVAFAAKAPLFPLHTWLADTTGQASAGTSVLLVCVLDKIGTYGMLRFCLGLLPEASEWATPLVLTLALISVVYGALLAIGSDDLLRLVGLTSLSHFGLITVGIFVWSRPGGSGAVLYMVNHGLATAALFLVAGYLVQRTGTTSIAAMGGVQKAAPVLAGLFVVAGMATVGLPGLSPFVSELLVIVAAFGWAWWVGAVAVTSIVLAAVYVLSAYRRTMTGPERPELAGVVDLSAREVWALAPVLVALVVLGVRPAPVLDPVDESVDRLFTSVGVVDDRPDVTRPDQSAEQAAEAEEVAP